LKIAMSFYQCFVLPRLIHLGMNRNDLAPYRARAAAGAAGRVLEIGIGSGLNMPFYGEAIREVIGLDASAPLLAMARRRRHLRPRVELIEATAESIPLEDRSIDTIVITWTLCSIGDPLRALGEMRRVLRGDGLLVFAEHGRAPDPRVERWQDRLTPIWSRVAGGCHLNRPIGDLIERGGFRIEHIENAYIPGPRPLTFMYEGSARPR
jgi:ubiquinone/menaquinone biosynthesis C-methylase UbiE